MNSEIGIEKKLGNDWKNEKLEGGYVKFEGNEGEAVLRFLTEQPVITSKTFEGQSVPSIRATWLVLDERDLESGEKSYETSKGGENSIYGRLQGIAKKHGGIKDLRVLFHWQGTGKTRNYVIKKLEENQTGRGGE